MAIFAFLHFFPAFLFFGCLSVFRLFFGDQHPAIPAKGDEHDARKRQRPATCHDEIGMGPEYLVDGPDGDCYQPHHNARCHCRVKALRGGGKTRRRGLRNKLDRAQMRRAEGQTVQRLHDEKDRERRAQRGDGPAQDRGDARQHQQADRAEPRH